MTITAERLDGASSLARGLSLLELFSPDDTEVSISELARRGGMPKSTTHRLVADLIKFGALERGRAGVRLGVRLFELGHLVPDHRRLRELAMPYARTLAEVSGLTANIAVREGLEVMYLEKIAHRDLSVPHSRVGGRLPMHATGLGKAILAYSPPAVVEAVLAQPLEKVSAATITDPDAFRRELERVRLARVAFDLEESRPGLFCVAAPIFARHDRVVGALSVTGATSRSEARSWAHLVFESAATLSGVLGGSRGSSAA